MPNQVSAGKLNGYGNFKYILRKNQRIPIKVLWPPLPIKIADIPFYTVSAKSETLQGYRLTIRRLACAL
jgi:hypothetical protein